MRTLHPTVASQLDEGSAAKRDMVLVDLPSGLWGFWTGRQPLVYNGITYVGAGSLISIQGLKEQSGLTAVPVVVSLRSVPDQALTPDILTTIEDEAYHQRPVTIFTAWLDPDTNALIAVDREYRGYCDRVAHRDQDGGATVLEATLESKARDHHKTLGRMRGDADQRRIDPNDGGLKYAGTASKFDLTWGRVPPGTPVVVP